MPTGDPYRSAPARPPSRAPLDPIHRDVAVVLAVVWIGSVLRVALAFGHGPLGAEPTIALGVVFLVPWLTWRLRRSSAAPVRDPDGG